MFNLYDILRSAHGGQALENLASQFNLSPEEADVAVKAVLQELSGGFLKHASDPVALGSLLGGLGQGHFREAFADPAAAQASAQKGGDHLSEILGSSATKDEIVQRASNATGLSQDMLSRMLPVIVSMIFGGLTKSLENQGFGSLLGQLSNAARQGTLGPALGHVLAGGAAPQTPDPQLGQEAGPLAGGFLGLILGSLRRLIGGDAESAAPGAPVPPPPSFDAASLQAGLNALKRLLQPGTPPPAPVPPPQAEAPAPPEAETPPPAPADAPPPEEQETDITAELDRIIGKHHD
jgi:hypothetical protein